MSAEGTKQAPGRIEKAFVARQPIYGGDLKVFAYELLFRNSDLDQEAFRNGDKATAQVVLDTFMDIGLDRVVGPGLAFVSVTRNFLLSDYCSLLPKERLVLQLADEIIPDKPMLDAVSRLCTEGYLFALDNVRYSEWLRPFLALTDVVKVDIRGIDRDAIDKQVELLRQFDLKLVAKNVENHEDYDYCKTLGFDYYQGSFISKPQIVSGEKMPANRMAALRLLSKLQDPNLTTDALEETLSQDVALSYKLIRYVNSAMHALPNEVSSIRHAIVLVGTRRISNWAGLILYGQMDDKPGELMISAIVRARMCQHIALATKQQNAEQFFTVGLFSVLDALLDRPMPDALEMLPLAPELKGALVDHQGLMGVALQSVMSYEVGDWDQAECAGISPETLYDSYVSALEWTRKTMKELGLESNLQTQESLRRRSEAKLKLHRFADEQEQQIKQIEDHARKKVTRDLLARFDVEFERLTLEYEEKQKQAVASTQSAIESRFKEALSQLELEKKQAEQEKEKVTRDFESAAEQWESERLKLMENEKAARQAAQASTESTAGLEARLSETAKEKESLAERIRTMEEIQAESEKAARQVVQASTESTAGLEARLSETAKEKESLTERLRTMEEIQADLESKILQLQSNPRNDVEKVVEQSVAESKPGIPRGAEGIQTEISRIQKAIDEITNNIESPATDLAAQIRLNRERSELEAYLKGLRY